MLHKVFCLELTGETKRFPQKILIFANNKEEAREYAHDYTPKKMSGNSSKVSEMEDNLFLDSSLSSCKELVEGKDYRVINKATTDNGDVILILLCENQQEIDLLYRFPKKID